MMNLAEYRRSTTRLADFLPWAALVDKGIVLNKDGSFQRTARFRGPDLDSSVPAELVAVAGRLGVDHVTESHGRMVRTDLTRCQFCGRHGTRADLHSWR